MSRVWTKRLGGLGAIALAAGLALGGPLSAGASAAGTTTTIPQKTVSGASKDTNNCQSKVDLTSPGTFAPVEGGIGVNVSADATPQPHFGDIITLSNLKLAVSIPASVLQVGVDAGLINDGDVIPSVVTLTITGTGTKEGSKALSLHTNATIHVSGGVAAPLKQSITLPDTKWTPTTDTTDVFFREGGLKIVSSIDLTASIGVVAVATFVCSPSGNAQIVAVGATGTPGTLPPPTTTTTTATTAPTTVAPTVAPAATGTGQLPRTGSSTGLLLGLAVLCLSAGLFALRATGRLGRRDVPSKS